MASDKTPGPAELCNLWIDLSDSFTDALNFSCGTGQLSMSQRLEIVKLIPTKDSFQQFEKLKWNKLVRAEIKAREYLLGQQKKSQSNKRQTEFVLLEVKLLLLT